MEQQLLKPDIFSYSTSTSQLPWIGALSMMLRMTQHTLLPNVVTYGALGAVGGHATMPEGCFRIFWGGKKPAVFTGFSGQRSRVGILSSYQMDMLVRNLSRNVMCMRPPWDLVDLFQG